MTTQALSLKTVAETVRKYAQTRIDFGPAAKLTAEQIAQILASEHEATTEMGAKRCISRWCRVQIAAMKPEDAAKFYAGPKRKPKLV